MNETLPAYGLWPLVVLNAGIVLLFASSFFKPQTKRDWRTFGAFSAFIVLAKAWRVLLSAQRAHTLAMTGPYAWMRHPQYVAFIVIMAGFLMLWPTQLTLLMFPALVAMYVRLAKREEREVLRDFGEEYARYVRAVLAFTPRSFGYRGRYGNERTNDGLR